ncbi:MAG: Crp/Fnr family transcriptional regulator, partial [Sphingomonas sp.]
MSSCLAERLSDHVRLSAAERDSLDRLEEQERHYRRGAVIVREQDKPRELYIVRSGWLHSSAALGNGGRQILRLHFAGDIIGAGLLAFRDSPEAITAITDVTLCPFSRERFAALLSEHPRLGALILGLSVAERVSLADRLASIGRTPARARVGALLCEIAARLRRAN